MKKNSIYPLVLIILITLSCTLSQCKQDKEIPNNLKSVSLWSDSEGVDPTMLLASLELINTAIDSIGYPDAGYKLWIVTEDSIAFRFMMEGLWPDMAAYDEIHDSEIYKVARDKYMSHAYEGLWNSLDMLWYSMFYAVEVE